MASRDGRADVKGCEGVKGCRGLDGGSRRRSVVDPRQQDRTGTGNGLLATAHQNNYTVGYQSAVRCGALRSFVAGQIPLASRAGAPPYVVTEYNVGEKRGASAEYSAICAPGLSLIARCGTPFIYCVPQRCRMPAHEHSSFSWHRATLGGR
jgi:hypothetical protein